MATLQFGNTSADMRLVNDFYGIPALRDFAVYLLGFESEREEIIKQTPTEIVFRQWNAANEPVTFFAKGSALGSQLFVANELAVEAKGIRETVKGTIQISLSPNDDELVTGTVTEASAANIADGSVIASLSGVSLPIEDALFAADDELLAGNDSVTSGSGNDYLLGYGGSDSVFAGAGDDTLDGGSGSDALAGGPGDDTYILNDNDTVTELSGAGTDTVRTTLASYTLPANVERLEYVGGGSIDATGNASANLLAGGPGDDSLDGAGGTDTAGYSAAFRQHTLSGDPKAGATVSGPEGTDSLTAIENVAFVDGRMTFDPNDHLAEAYRLYFATLDRAPDALGLNYQSARLDAGTSLSDVAAGFVNSPEFQGVYGPLTDEQFVDLLYQNVLDRSATPDEIAYHVGRLESGASRADVVVGFSESPEYIQTHIDAINAGLWDIDEGLASVSRLYFGMLERTPETAGLSYYKEALANGLTVQQVANGFANSPEFFAKYGPLSDPDYVTQLYENILERTPAPAEVAYHVNRLDNGASRGDVAAGFTEAPEYQIQTLSLVDPGIAVADAGFVLP